MHAAIMDRHSYSYRRHCSGGTIGGDHYTAHPLWRSSKLPTPENLLRTPFALHADLADKEDRRPPLLLGVNHADALRCVSARAFSRGPPIPLGKYSSEEGPFTSSSYGQSVRTTEVTVIKMLWGQ